MKNLSLILLTIFTSIVVSAQTLTLRFENSSQSNSSAPGNYRIDVDGKKYYSANASASANSKSKQLVINQLALGLHTLNVYDLVKNSAPKTGTNAVEAYSNTFQLRTGYDMMISIRKNGQVSFSEKKIDQSTAAVPKQPMQEADFNKLAKSITDKWSQTSRFDSVKRAFANKTYFFTTEQAGQLILLITAEPKRLELAKLSYSKVTDTSNFADVAELFKTQQYKDSIDRFIQSKKPAVTVSNTGVGNSRVPLTTTQFSQLQRRINGQYEQAGKIAVLSEALNVNTNYFTTQQMRELLSLINLENDRLDLAIQAYPRISDVANFSSLQNIFPTQAIRDEFNYFIRYGSSTGFTGQYSNRTAMSDEDFNSIQLKLYLRFSQSGMVTEIRKALSDVNNYFSLDQTRTLLTKVTAEADRLSLAKLAYHRAVDPTQFTQLFDLFNSQTSRNELSYYMRTNPS